MRKDVESGTLQGAYSEETIPVYVVEHGYRNARSSRRASHRKPRAAFQACGIVTRRSRLPPRGSLQDPFAGSSATGILEQAQGQGVVVRIWPRSTRKSEGPMAEDGKKPGSEGSEEIDPSEAQAGRVRADPEAGGPAPGRPTTAARSRSSSVRGEGPRPVHETGRSAKAQDGFGSTGGDEESTPREERQGDRSGHGVHFERQLLGGGAGDGHD